MFIVDDVWETLNASYMSYCDVHPSPLTSTALPGSFWQMAWGPKALLQSTTPQTFPWHYNYARRISFVSTMLNQKNNQIWQKEFCKLICMVQSKLRYSHFEGKLAYHRSCLRFVLVVWSVKPGASFGYACATSHGQCGLSRGEAGSAHT